MIPKTKSLPEETKNQVAPSAVAAGDTAELVEETGTSPRKMEVLPKPGQKLVDGTPESVEEIGNGTEEAVGLIAETTDLVPERFSR